MMYWGIPIIALPRQPQISLLFFDFQQPRAVCSEKHKDLTCFVYSPPTNQRKTQGSDLLHLFSPHRPEIQIRLAIMGEVEDKDRCNSKAESKPGPVLHVTPD